MDTASAQADSPAVAERQPHRRQPFEALDKLPRRDLPGGGRVVMIPMSTRARSVTGVIYGRQEPSSKRRQA